MNSFKLILNCDDRLALPPDLLEAIEKIDSRAPIKRNWCSVIEHLETQEPIAADVVIDVMPKNARPALEHLQELWKVRVANNYSPGPLYIALSCVAQPPSLRYEIRRLGGRFMHVCDVRRHFLSEMEEARLQLDEVRLGFPEWEIIEEQCGSDPQRVYVKVRFLGRTELVQGSDRHHAELVVLLKNNGIPRSMRAIRQLCSEDPLFVPAGGPFAVPQLATLKMHIYRDFPEYLQRAFDSIRSGYRAERVIEHIDRGAKAMGFRVRGHWRMLVR